jgi:hypothetical protein
MGGRREKETRMLLLMIHHHTGEGYLVDDEDTAGYFLTPGLAPFAKNEHSYKMLAILY